MCEPDRLNTGIAYVFNTMLPDTTTSIATKTTISIPFIARWLPA